MNPVSAQQIFQTNSHGRWLTLKWASRFFLLLALLAVGILVITLAKDYTPSLPRLKNQQYKKALTASSYVSKNSLIARQYGGYRRFMTRLNGPVPALAHKGHAHQQPAVSLNTALDSTNPLFNQFPCGIRSAFYVTWDPQSFYSLQRNISRLNLVIPEWMFLDPVADTLKIQKDDRAFQVMKKAGVKIMPILSNNFNEVFRGDVVNRIINNKEKRERLINGVLNELEKNNFIGVNVDFEELDQESDRSLIAFQKELYTRLHAHHLLVTQEVVPFNEDYNYKELSKYNDYIFLMAYDQFSDQTAPGPICDQHWIEAAVDEAARKIPASKIILDLAAYGYDWPKGSEGESVTYQKALQIARDEEGTIAFNNDTYNLGFTYTDDNKVPHTVYFTDAATSFNTMRFATEYGLAGVGLWRLGSEDSRIWEFYNEDMRKQALQQFDFTRFRSVQSSDDVDYSGEGEVLDIIATPTNGRITPELDQEDMLISEEHYDSLPSMFVVQKYGQADQKKLVLTFDDGPDPVYTPKILDILSKEHVPATFFLVGINAEDNIPLVKRIYREGHEIGNHTFTHPNVARICHSRALLEMESTRLLLECITGHSTILFRAPYNADAEPEKMEELLPVAIARTKNYLDIGESIDPEDWNPGVSADTILQRIIRRKQELTDAGLGGNIILLHDAGGESRAATVAALPKIIRYYKQRGYQFTTVADILHKSKNELMPEVPKGSGYYLLEANYFLAEFGYWGSHILFSLFVVFIVLSVLRILFLAFLATRQHMREKEGLPVAAAASLSPARHPFLSVIVPAYNEEVNAVGSLHNLLKTDYPNLEIIFVDDGSKDQTYQKVKQAFTGHPQVRIFTKPNGGKASALNYGILQSVADYVVCIDADTKLLPDAISKLMAHFMAAQEEETDKPLGAVAGNVKVGNKVNLLTHWQSIEYISSQNFDRKAFAGLNAITVVPGAIGAFYKKAIQDAGGFTTDTLAEDCDLTIRILRNGYRVENENGAIALTEAPETLAMFIKQRFRWSFGVMQTFWKHRDTLLKRRHKWLGWAAMPNILVYQYIIPAVIPLADLFMLIGILSGNGSKILLYYTVFMLIDLLVALLAFSFEKEKISNLVWLIPQRLVWRWLMWFVLYKSFVKAIKGEFQNWGVLKRTGNVKDILQPQQTSPVYHPNMG
ncbi:MAG: glycosyltransferase [Williamsia sp.]|nr:glycosyltransferase [Williamsia sp.]